MKDDSLSDVAYCNTKEGMHSRAKKLGVKAYSLGCSCSACNDGFARMIDSVGKPKRSECKCLCHTDANTLGLIDVPMHVELCCVNDIGKQGNVYAKQIWNDAIEAACNSAKTWMNKEYANCNLYVEIRKLKK